VELVRGHGKKINAKVLYIDRDLRNCLDCIGVEVKLIQAASTRVGDYGGDWFQWLDRPSLVIDKHHSYQNGLVSDRVSHVFGIYQARGRHGKISDLKTGLLEGFARRKHCRVFDFCRDYVPAPISVGLGYSADRKVIRFGSSRHKHYLSRSGIDESCDLSTSLFDS
jgi:hypothetical protein